VQGCWSFLLLLLVLIVQDLLFLLFPACCWG
jgi:hypothetical protein